VRHDATAIASIAIRLAVEARSASLTSAIAS
jgi:hypothetical protein